jgi:hypothetical protein
LVQKNTQAHLNAINSARTRSDVFGATNCYIKTKKGGDLVLFKPNEVQRILDAFVKIRLEQKRPAWFIVLKARQLGVSIWGLKQQYSRINFNKNHDCLFAAHDDDSTVKLFDRVTVMQENNPEAYPTKVANVRQLKLQHQNSSMTIQTMGKGELGRSGEFKDVHLSELAFSEYAENVMTSVVATMPDEHINHDSIFCIESTANGQGGKFYDLWRESTPLFNKNYVSLPESKSDRVGIFFPWQIFEANQMEAPKGFKEGLTDFDCDIFGNEKEIMDLWGMSLRQMAWRRWQIMNKYDNKLDKFTQENPSNDAEAFLSTGRPVFAQNSIMYQRNHVQNPLYRSVLNEELYMNKGQYSMIQVYEPVVEGAHYVIGFDPAEGIDKNEKNDPDASSVHIMRLDTQSVVAKINTQSEISLVCIQVDRLGRYYNDAWLAFEVNNTMGGTARQIFKDREYPNLYVREVTRKIADEMTEEIGWRTDLVTRGALVSDLQEMVRDRLITIVCKETLDQMGFFVVNKNGKAEAKSGEHDDDVMSLGLCVQLLIKLLRQGKQTEIIESRPMHHTERPDYDGTDSFYTDTLSFNGAVDMMEDIEEDDESW